VAPWTPTISFGGVSLLPGSTAGPVAERGDLAREMPDVDAAYRPHGDKLCRAIVEARLLARQSFGQVAAACSLSPATATAYEALFFIVTDNLIRMLKMKAIILVHVLP
jgi:hypothetical protein